MGVFSSTWGILSAFIVFLFGLIVTQLAGRRLLTNSRRSFLIYIWHTGFCLIYLWYSLNNVSDAIGYYSNAHLLDFALGTTAIHNVTAIFIQGFGLSILGVFLVFNIFGAVGLQIFDACLRAATYDKPRAIQRLASLIVFLPSVSFWSSAIGKDAFSFLATSLALWSALDLKRRFLIMSFSVVIMLLVRPHIAGLIIISITLAFIFEKKTAIGERLFLGGISAAFSAVLIPTALSYAGLGEAIDIESTSNYIEARQTHNMEGGSGDVDIAKMTLPMQLFTYVFRPIIFEVSSVYGLVSALDNLVLLYIFVVGVRRIFRYSASVNRANRSFMWIYALMVWLILALTTANLGIAIRQKWLFMPMFIYLFISVLGPRKVTPLR